MKITKMKIEGFRSFKSQSWSPGDLNVVIGPNASGKTNLLRALEIFGNAAKGGLGKYVQQEGGMEPLVWDGQANEIRLGTKMTPILPFRDDVKDALTYEIVLARLGKSSSYRIDYEVLANFYEVEIGKMREPSKLLERNPNHAVVYSIDSKRFEAAPASVPEDEALLSVAAGPFTANRYVASFQMELADWKVYQNVHTHREAQVRVPQVTRAETQVNSDGQNLVSVLHNLYTSSREFENEINQAMTSAFGDDFEKLVFPPAADQRIQLRVRWRSMKREQSAADLSDGTLRFLFLLAVLANPSPPPLIAIDEPEMGLHPSMFPIVAEFARDAATKSQVILTTHSPEFLDAFGHEAPTTTVVERQEGQTVLRVLSDDDLAYWLQQYSLGELFRSNELETMR
jgi:predicted ATPase